MDEMTPFLRRIAEQPDDDVARLVFADWLEEHGRGDRAEFIRLQVGLARMDTADPSYPEKTARMHRCGVLTRAGEVPFFDHIPNSDCRIAFHGGMIGEIHTARSGSLDTSGFDLVPLQSLRTDGQQVEHFRRFSKLARLELHGSEVTPERFLETLGPGGWFPNLERLCLPYFSRACLEAGVLPRCELPRLRELFLFTDSFVTLGERTPRDEEDEDDDPWHGLAEWMPRHAFPGANSPLERFVWHADDDSDLYRGGDWFWAGPSLESLLEHRPGLKQVEVALDHDDHECGGEGVIAASFTRDPFALAPQLESITLGDAGDWRFLHTTSRRLKGLRVYGSEGFEEEFIDLLRRPVCAELESLRVEARFGRWYGEAASIPAIRLERLKSLDPGGMAWLLANGDFPALISLTGEQYIPPLLNKRWPSLQRLSVYVDSNNLADLRALAKSDCFPNLTTLTIHGYFEPNRAVFSFLARCPHMPFLSLILLPGLRGASVVDDGRFHPVRADVMADELPPTTAYRLNAVF